jgi:hypothetical protein
MSISAEIEKLEKWISLLPEIGMETLGGAGKPVYILDLIIIGVIKRSLSLASGLHDLVKSKNMICSRAILRMELDTVSRLLAYTYVNDPSEMAKDIIGGKALNSFKCRDGKQLRDGYLIDKMSEKYPWVKDVYKYTSGYVHFSERQVFDSIFSLGKDEERLVTFQVSKEDHNFPEESWIEIIACFNEMLSILSELLLTHRNELKQAEV